MTAADRKFIVFTWGCQMNEDDSLEIASLLMQMGCSPTQRQEAADIAVLVTCSVRAKPEEKARSKLGELRLEKLRRPEMIIGVCGCMAQREGEALKKGRPYIDFVVGTSQIQRIPGIIREIEIKRAFRSALELPRGPSDPLAIPPRIERAGGALKSFVPAMYGCDNFCAYCIVPYVRGRERSRSVEDIVGELQRLAAGGTKEITLLGQNVNSYGATLSDVSPSPQPSLRLGSGQAPARGEGALDRARLEEAAPFDGAQDAGLVARQDGGRVGHQDAGLVGRVDFADLLRAASEVEGIERIRFTTSHPKDLSDRLTEAMAELPKVCEHIHLAVQSGDDRVLARMNRKYTAAHVNGRIAALRSAVPEISITTDFLVGFPGETEEQFENTLRLAEEIRFDSAFMFAFNPIPGTAAAKLAGGLAKDVKLARLKRLIQLQNAITCEINASQVGRSFEVLVEGVSPKDRTRMTGLTRQNKTVNFPRGSDLAGKLVQVRATEGHLYGFVGRFESLKV